MNTETRRPTGSYLFRCSAKHATYFATLAELEAHQDRMRAASKCGCGRPARRVAIEARVTETRCGARCTSALGPSCDCECGGREHGSDHRKTGE